MISARWAREGDEAAGSREEGKAGGATRLGSCWEIALSEGAGRRESEDQQPADKRKKNNFLINRSFPSSTLWQTLA